MPGACVPGDRRVLLAQEDIIRTVCTPHGKVLSVTVTRAPDGQSLTSYVEFDSHESVAKARAALDGQHIYEKCCFITVRFPCCAAVTPRSSLSDCIGVAVLLYILIGTGYDSPATRSAVVTRAPPVAAR